MCDNHTAYPTKPRPQHGMDYCLDNQNLTTIVWQSLCKIGILIDDVHPAYPTKPRPICMDGMDGVLMYGVGGTTTNSMQTKTAGLHFKLKVQIFILSLY